ncbi:DUF3106 domain-containing protein [Stenotrophomonas sp.]|uniref:DUF3106 domain-containing protein n=1 Tax=Stenotrophomonas sp. TaxID=69392 RepID=UPI0028A9A42E|nr:DUF3106 domain-containing protein [Stenotrophomonas sp.]
MKTLLPYLLLLACASAPAAAQQQLPEWDQLTPAQRETLIAQVRDRWNSSSPERRQRSYEHARSWQQMTPQQREQARRGMHRFENMSPDQRRDAQALFDKMRGMDKEQRQQLREQWNRMSVEQRRQWVQANPPAPRPPR